MTKNNKYFLMTVGTVAIGLTGLMIYKMARKECNMGVPEIAVLGGGLVLGGFITAKVLKKV